MRPNARKVLLGVALVTATLAVYRDAFRFEFVLYDDPSYVTENPQVQAGLSWEGAAWAFSTAHTRNWHPLTWLSHMLDCQLFGLDPAGPHVVNAALHVANALLLFGVLDAMTRARGRSAFVAALFALHPLHVESVAWVAERKDLLSTLLGLSALAAYVAYARRSGVWRYAFVTLLFALGLTAKSMLVTLPLVFLLLDDWPLARLSRDSWRRLAVEKLPLLALAALASAVTYLVQDPADVRASELVPLPLRLANAAVCYVRYLAKALWPSDLSVLYPHPDLPGGTPLEAWQVIGSLALVAGLTVAALRLPRAAYLRTGWLWYAVTLAPVIGLVQVGKQAMADRYTYLPLIGIFIVVSFGGFDLLKRLFASETVVRRVALAVALLASIPLALAAHARSAVWRDSVALFEQSLKSAPGSPDLHLMLGNALISRGQVELATPHYRSAAEIQPDLPSAHANLGFALLAQGRGREAIPHLRRALELKPDYAKVHNNLANLLKADGELEEAIDHYRQALAVRPDYAEAHFNLGTALAAAGDPEGALAQLARARELRPDWPAPLSTAAWLLATHPDPAVRDPARALDLASQAVRDTREEDAASLNALAAAAAAAGRFELAVEMAEKALASASLDPRADRAAGERLELYRQGKPYTQAPSPPEPDR